ncbi:hypothetical protein BDY19DRAFT_999038, partial [Irpex rosettiformis]
MGDACRKCARKDISERYQLARPGSYHIKCTALGAIFQKLLQGRLDLDDYNQPGEHAYAYADSEGRLTYEGMRINFNVPVSDEDLPQDPVSYIENHQTLSPRTEGPSAQLSFNREEQLAPAGSDLDHRRHRYTRTSRSPSPRRSETHQSHLGSTARLRSRTPPNLQQPPSRHSQSTLHSTEDERPTVLRGRTPHPLTSQPRTSTNTGQLRATTSSSVYSPRNPLTLKDLLMYRYGVQLDTANTQSQAVAVQLGERELLRLMGHVKEALPQEISTNSRLF